MKTWIIVVLLVLLVLMYVRKSNFMQEPLQLGSAEENVLKFSRVLQSCGNTDIPWKTCSQAFAGLPWQMKSMFETDMRPIMCNPDDTINEAGLRKFISCPK